VDDLPETYTYAAARFGLLTRSLLSRLGATVAPSPAKDAVTATQSVQVAACIVALVDVFTDDAWSMNRSIFQVCTTHAGTATQTLPTANQVRMPPLSLLTY
jgi:hypothetical protein